MYLFKAQVYKGGFDHTNATLNRIDLNIFAWDLSSQPCSAAIFRLGSFVLYILVFDSMICFVVGVPQIDILGWGSVVRDLLVWDL